MTCWLTSLTSSGRTSFRRYAMPPTLLKGVNSSSPESEASARYEYVTPPCRVLARGGCRVPALVRYRRRHLDRPAHRRVCHRKQNGGRYTRSRFRSSVIEIWAATAIGHSN